MIDYEHYVLREALTPVVVDAYRELIEIYHAEPEAGIYQDCYHRLVRPPL